jgi:leader peptidase (prepilin peptidase)/N-methyltransferase
LELIPLISYFVARGRCRRCGGAISGTHVALEAGAALIGGVAFAALPLLPAALTALFGWWLLLIAVLDLEHHWLPDLLTLPLIAAGLGAALVSVGVPLADRAIGAAAGYAVLAAIALLYRRLRGRVGLGGGDPKLFAALGAWLGWQQLPFVLVGAGLLGLASLLLRRLRGDTVGATDRLPLGTLMAVAAWPLWLLAAANSVTNAS